MNYLIVFYTILFPRRQRTNCALKVVNLELREVIELAQKR